MAIMTPATTIVEEWSKEETGVGLSIAVGNQYPNTQIADLPKLANKTINHTLSFSVSKRRQIIPKSPIRL
jgi:hypothetical protein